MTLSASNECCLSFAGARLEEAQKIEMLKAIFRRSDGVHQCTKCSYSSKRIAHVKRHVSLLHLDIWPFACTLCPSTFKIEEFRNQHYKRAHFMHVNSSDVRVMQAKMM